MADPAGVVIPLEFDVRVKKLNDDIRRAQAGIQKIRLNVDFATATRGSNDLRKSINQLTESTQDFGTSLERGLRRIVALSAGSAALFGITKAFKESLAASRELEKSLQSINVVLNLPTEELQQFSKSLFDVARNTTQTFSEVAKSATEFSRQGLGAEEILKRTSAALILVNLAGIDAGKATETITAAVNSFNKENLKAIDVVNKLVAVDARFAVSSADLSEAITRVGSTAQDAGVGLDRLISITTAAQQVTQRGGAIIGNSLKTIFQRLQRPETIQALEELGIQVREVSSATGELTGKLLPADQILRQLGERFKTLTQEQQAQTSELVAGVFQGNVFRGILRGLSFEQEAYQASLQATDEAIRRNAALLETQDAKIKKVSSTLLQAGANVGRAGFGEQINKALNGLNTGEGGGVGANIAGNILQAFSGNAGEAGNEFAKIFIKSVSDVILGPGIILLGATLVKVATTLGGFASKVFSQLNPFSQKDVALGEQIEKLIIEQGAGIQAINAQNISREAKEKLILDLFIKQNAVLAEQRVLAASTTKILSTNQGAAVVGAFNRQSRTVRTGAGGIESAYIREQIAILDGVGGAPKDARPVFKQLSDGPAVVNTSEYTDGRSVLNRDMVRNLGGVPKGFVPITAAAGHVPNLAGARLERSGNKFFYNHKSGQQSRFEIKGKSLLVDRFGGDVDNPRPGEAIGVVRAIESIIKNNKLNQIDAGAVVQPAIIKFLTSQRATSRFKNIGVDSITGLFKSSRLKDSGLEEVFNKSFNTRTFDKGPSAGDPIIQFYRDLAGGYTPNLVTGRTGLFTAEGGGFKDIREANGNQLRFLIAARGGKDAFNTNLAETLRQNGKIVSEIVGTSKLLFPMVRGVARFRDFIPGPNGFVAGPKKPGGIPQQFSRRGPLATGYIPNLAAAIISNGQAREEGNKPDSPSLARLRTIFKAKGLKPADLGQYLRENFGTRGIDTDEALRQVLSGAPLKLTGTQVRQAAFNVKARAIGPNAGGNIVLSSESINSAKAAFSSQTPSNVSSSSLGTPPVNVLKPSGKTFRLGTGVEEAEKANTIREAAAKLELENAKKQKNILTETAVLRRANETKVLPIGSSKGLSVNFRTPSIPPRSFTGPVEPSVLGGTFEEQRALIAKNFLEREISPSVLGRRSNRGQTLDTSPLFGRPVPGLIPSLSNVPGSSANTISRFGNKITSLEETKSIISQASAATRQIKNIDFSRASIDVQNRLTKFSEKIKENSDIITSSTASEAVKNRAVKRLAIFTNLVSESAKTQIQANKDLKIAQDKEIKSAARRSAIGTGGLAATFAIPAAVELFSSSFSAGQDAITAQRTQRGFSTAGQGLSTAAAIASVAPAAGPVGGPALAIIAAIVAGYSIFKGNKEATQDSAEDTGKRLDELINISSQNQNAIQSSRIANVRVADLISQGGSKVQIQTAKQEALLGTSGITSKEVRKALREQILTGDFSQESNAKLNDLIAKTNLQEGTKVLGSKESFNAINLEISKALKPTPIASFLGKDLGAGFSREGISKELQQRLEQAEEARILSIQEGPKRDAELAEIEKRATIDFVKLKKLGITKRQEDLVVRDTSGKQSTAIFSGPSLSEQSARFKAISEASEKRKTAISGLQTDLGSLGKREDVVRIIDTLNSASSSAEELAAAEAKLEVIINGQTQAGKNVKEGLIALKASTDSYHTTIRAGTEIVRRQNAFQLRSIQNEGKFNIEQAGVRASQQSDVQLLKGVGFGESQIRGIENANAFQNIDTQARQEELQQVESAANQFSSIILNSLDKLKSNDLFKGGNSAFTALVDQFNDTKTFKEAGSVIEQLIGKLGDVNKGGPDIQKFAIELEGLRSVLDKGSASITNQVNLRKTEINLQERSISRFKQSTSGLSDIQNIVQQQQGTRFTNTIGGREPAFTPEERVQSSQENASLLGATISLAGELGVNSSTLKALSDKQKQFSDIFKSSSNDLAQKLVIQSNLPADIKQALIEGLQTAKVENQAIEGAGPETIANIQKAFQSALGRKGTNLEIESVLRSQNKIGVSETISEAQGIENANRFASQLESGIIEDFRNVLSEIKGVSSGDASSGRGQDISIKEQPITVDDALSKVKELFGSEVKGSFDSLILSNENLANTFKNLKGLTLTVEGESTTKNEVKLDVAFSEEQLASLSQGLATAVGPVVQQYLASTKESVESIKRFLSKKFEFAELPISKE